MVQQALKRGLKRCRRALLGQGRLETRSRLWMALVLLLVIGGTFYWVARRTRQQIMEQMFGKAKLVAGPVLAQRADDIRDLQTLEGRPQDFLHSAEQDLLKTRGFRWRYIYPGTRFGTFRPRFNWEQLLLDRLDEGRPRKRWDRDFEDPNNGQRLYQLLVPIPAEAGCHTCHSDLPAKGFQGVLSVELPFDREQRDLSNTRTFMIVSAIGALVVALVTLYLLMRYLIIEPLHRLKDTTDAVAAGDLQARAEVRTGDELEEFANALNHMVESVEQSHQALAELNLSLDAQLDALGRANLELHEMNQVRTEFLANMSHELRSPLHSVLGFAQILLEETYGPLTPRQQRYIQNMVSSGRDLLHLINNLLEMSRIEAGRMQKNLDRVPLADLVHSVVAQLEPLRGDSLTVTVEVQEDLPPVFIDPRKTSRILSNLLSNAYKFTPEDGQVSVRGAMEDDRLVLSVSDTGIGIQDCDLTRIFDKFRQVDSGTGRRFEGSGLGLAIVRELARFLGGEVTVTSTPGEGSTFTVTLPLVTGETGVSPTLGSRADAPGKTAGE